jgi:predicted kinase
MNLDKFNRLDVIIICGLPGAGKSQFAEDNFKDTDRKRINRGEIRRFLYEMTNFNETWHENMFNEKQEYLVKHVEIEILDYFLYQQKKVLIDNTSITRESRKPYIDKARQKGKSVGIIFINTPVKRCIERSKKKDEHIDTNVISNLYAKIDLPKNSRDENVKETLIIDEY